MTLLKWTKSCSRLICWSRRNKSVNKTVNFNISIYVHNACFAVLSCFLDYIIYNRFNAFWQIVPACHIGISDFGYITAANLIIFYRPVCRLRKALSLSYNTYQLATGHSLSYRYSVIGISSVCVNIRTVWAINPHC